MSEQNEPIEAVNMQFVDEQILVGAKIEEVDFGLPADYRCDYCSAQAYVEIEVFDNTDRKRRDLYFCAHDYNAHRIALSAKATRIVDHTPVLRDKPVPAQ
jgi:hypothetical protein